jgi:hypothetical protein
MTRSGILSALIAVLMLPRPAVAQVDAGPETLARDGGDLGASTGDAETARPGSSPDLETFQRRLSPHGKWVDSTRYGRVWRPRAPADWRPYYHGHWTWTDDGWFWVSDEPWAWATYHYGRWGNDALGWFWVPGYEWAPAWVTWRFGGGIVGWAPLFPRFSIFATTHPAFFFAWTFVPAVRFVGFPVFRVAFAPVLVPRFFFVTQPAPPRRIFHGVRTALGRSAPPLGESGSTPIAHGRSAPGSSPGRVMSGGGCRAPALACRRRPSDSSAPTSGGRDASRAVSAVVMACRWGAVLAAACTFHSADMRAAPGGADSNSTLRRGAQQERSIVDMSRP